MSEGHESSKQTQLAEERPERVGHCSHGAHPSAVHQRAPWGEYEAASQRVLFQENSGTNTMGWNQQSG